MTGMAEGRGGDDGWRGRSFASLRMTGGGGQQMGLDEVPAGYGPWKSLSVRVVLPKPQIAYDGLGLDPPLTGTVRGAVRMNLVHHRSVGKKSLVPSGAESHAIRLDIFSHLRISQGLSAFQKEP